MPTIDNGSSSHGESAGGSSVAGAGVGVAGVGSGVGSGAGGAGGKCSVLIVEDDRIIREALTKILLALGYRVCAVASVAEGAEKLDGQACAILDLNLPDGLGTHILRRIRDEGRPIRVAVVSGSHDPELIWSAHQGGADLVLRKPVSVNVLVAWLDKNGK